MHVDQCPGHLRRSTFLKMGAAGAAALAVGAAGENVVPGLRKRGLFSANGVFDASSTALADLIYLEVFPTSPLILKPFRDPLPVPRALAPVPYSIHSTWDSPPSGGPGRQNSLGNETHQIWPSRLGYPDPVVYKIDLKVAGHDFTSSPVLPIDV